jgi:hypothetical protein
MLCVICKRKFNKESSYYRHQWSDKHLLKQQILEYEKEIKTLEQKIAQNEVALNELSQYHTKSEKQSTHVQDPFK